MSRNGGPSFHEYYQAYREKNEEARLIAFALVDLKRQGAIARVRARKSRLASIQAENAAAEAKHLADRARYAAEQEQFRQRQEQMRVSTLSTRRGW